MRENQAGREGMSIEDFPYLFFGMLSVVLGFFLSLIVYTIIGNTLWSFIPLILGIAVFAFAFFIRIIMTFRVVKGKRGN